MLYALYIVTATVMLLCLAFAPDMRVLRTLVYAIAVMDVLCS